MSRAPGIDPPVKVGKIALGGVVFPKIEVK